MKTTIVATCAALAAAASLHANPITLNFDDLHIGTGTYANIPNGYGGLQWNNFGAIISSTVQQQNSGYHTGLISPGNVAFDFYGDPASVSSPVPLNFLSLYLTSTFEPVSTIEIIGTGPGVKFDHTYTINSNAPTLITLNYTGVENLYFDTPADHFFVLDDLTVNVPDPANTLTLLTAALTLCALIPKRFRAIRPTK